MAHANNVVAVLRVVGAVAEASVGGRVRGVSHKVDTVHAAVGGGRVLVPLRREGGTWVATKQHTSGWPPSDTHQVALLRRKGASRAGQRVRAHAARRARGRRVQTHAASSQGLGAAGPGGAGVAFGEVGAVVPGRLPHDAASARKPPALARCAAHARAGSGALCWLSAQRAAGWAHRRLAGHGIVVHAAVGAEGHVQGRVSHARIGDDVHSRPHGVEQLGLQKQRVLEHGGVCASFSYFRSG